MRIKLITGTIVGALACAMLGAVVATAGSGAPDKAEFVAPERADVVPPATAPNARAAALVSSEGSFIRQKGFLRITHPLTGAYCLKLKSTIDEDTLVASVTPEYWHSPQFRHGASWNSNQTECPNRGNWVEVYTFSEVGLDDAWELADEGFSIVIP